MKQFIISNWIRMVVGLAIGITIYIVYVAVRNGWSILIYHVDALFYAAATLVFLGLLILMTNLGAGDIFAYRFRRRRLPSGQKETLYEYSQRKKQERAPMMWSFFSYLIVAIPFIIALIIIYSALVSSIS